MRLLTRLINVFRRDRIAGELDDEMAAHLEEAVECGRDPREARRSLGASLQHREQSRDIKIIPWLDALASDVVFGWRQIRKHPVASGAAVLSLALAIGATTSTFRLIDAFLLRRLPVADPDRLYVLAMSYTNQDGRPDYRDDFDYPTYRRYTKALSGTADLILLGGSVQQDVTFGSPDSMEKFYREYVSGNAFVQLGLQPALGRLIAPGDDTSPGGHPIAVLSHDYWRHRFARDPAVIGKTFQMSGSLYEIIGVAPEGFTGAEPGAITDVFIPATMNTRALNSDGWSWFRIWVRPRPGVRPEQIAQPLNARLAIQLREQVSQMGSDTPKAVADRYLQQSISLVPASTGVSAKQRELRRPLLILALLVALVLLIACGNVGNLLVAQAAARAREMALRVSIGAGQWRLIQLVMVESAMLAILASLAAALFSLWTTPLLVSMLAPPEDPVRLVLAPDWRVLGFGVLLALAVTLLFGLVPALRASGVKPVAALKGAEDPRARRGPIYVLVAAQVAFCVLVLFVAGLFVSTFERLATRPLGFTAEHLVMAGTMFHDSQPAETWRQLMEELRHIPQVQSASYAGWSPLSGNHWTRMIRVPGHAAEPQPPYFLDVSPGYFGTMRIGWIDGRQFRPGDRDVKLDADKHPVTGVGIVNEAFARIYFGGQNPVGRVVEVWKEKDVLVPMEIVGYVRDSCYSNVREIIRPTVYVPIESRNQAAVMIRSTGSPLALAADLRRQFKLARAEMRLGDVQLETALVNRQMIRERLLAMLSAFFAVLALVLAAVGLFGVLNYAVIRRRREIGIRIALGARSGSVVRQITSGAFAAVLCGATAGLFGGLAAGRLVESLLYEVKPDGAPMLAAPVVILLLAALIAAVPPAVRATRVDPIETLRE
jgi:predicted permease